MTADLHGIPDGPGRLLLEAAGWRPGRTVEVSGLVRDMTVVGFDVSASARRFLESFQGLHIVHPPSVTVNGREHFCRTDVDPARVCTERDADVAARCSSVVGESLCPVGVDGFHLTVYVTPSGRFFAGMDASVFTYADSTEELFTKLAAGIRPQHAADWEL
ncbi:SUKH-3 domain-containing protein [Streptomyces sp. NPDC004031]